MIKILKSANDKMNMIPIIKLINKRIKLFFDNLKLNKITNLNDEEIIANILNINGSWGSGKSTIVNNLEYYYQYKNDIEKPKFLIINLWEYETSSDPYFDLINDIANKLISFSKINEQKKQQEITKIRKLSFSLRIKYYDWEFTPDIGYESSKKINNQKLMKEIIEEIINELNSFVNKNKIVVIFDELDRCTPTNQIIFLSYIKNIFCKITNIFFIVSSNNEVIHANISNISIQKDNILMKNILIKFLMWVYL